MDEADLIDQLKHRCLDLEAERDRLREQLDRCECGERADEIGANHD